MASYVSVSLHSSYFILVTATEPIPSFYHHSQAPTYLISFRIVLEGEIRQLDTTLDSITAIQPPSTPASSISSKKLLAPPSQDIRYPGEYCSLGFFLLFHVHLPL